MRVRVTRMTSSTRTNLSKLKSTNSNQPNKQIVRSLICHCNSRYRQFDTLINKNEIIYMTALCWAPKHALSVEMARFWYCICVRAWSTSSAGSPPHLFLLTTSEGLRNYYLDGAKVFICCLCVRPITSIGPFPVCRVDHLPTVVISYRFAKYPLHSPLNTKFS